MTKNIKIIKNKIFIVIFNFCLKKFSIGVEYNMFRFKGDVVKRLKELKKRKTKYFNSGNIAVWFRKYQEEWLNLTFLVKLHEVCEDKIMRSL